MAVDVRLLGSVECFEDREPIRVPGTSARAVLAMLALRPGDLVLSDEIIEGLWGAGFPLDPIAAVHVTISRLRRALGKNRERLRSVALGYVLDLPAADVDVGRVEESIRQGRLLLEDDRPLDALSTLDSALAEWRHESPLAEFADLPFATTAASRLQLLRVELVEVANEAALKSDRPAEVISRSERVLASDPWREQLVSQLMVALYQTGRSADALVAYSQLASRLRADFGTEPSPALAALRTQVLSHDPTIGRHRASGGQAESLPTWFRSVLDDLGDDEEDLKLRCRLRLALGEAQHHAGLPGWQETLVEAGALATEASDMNLVAKCALGGALGWSLAPGTPDDRRLQLLSSVLAEPGSVNDELRARLLAAYANELAFGSSLEERLSYSDDAVALARATGKPALLLSILNQRFNAIWAPETLPIRLRETEEARRIAEASGQLVTQEIAAGFAMAACLESCDIRGTDRHLGRFVSLAEQLGFPVFTWGATLHASWRAVVAGDLEEAERLCDRARRIGLAGNRPEADFVHLSQLIGIRWAQGRMGEQIRTLQRMCDSTPALEGFRASHALASFHAGQDGPARMSLLDAWNQGSIHALPHDQIHLMALVHWGELASALKEVEVSRGLFEMLGPYRDQFCFTGAAVYGPVAHVLGLLAMTTGDGSVALENLRHSEGIAHRMGSPFFARRSERAKQLLATHLSDG
jgi:DNA-binding SARP family transcriptional activator